MMRFAVNLSFPLTSSAQVYESWVKCIMNPFYQANQVVTSPIFRSRVATAAKKYL